MYRSETKISTEKEEENSYVAYSSMEDLLEKLKILNYESEFILSLKMKPIHRYRIRCK